MILVRACTIFIFVFRLFPILLCICVYVCIFRICVTIPEEHLPGACTSRLHTNRGCETVPIKIRFFEVFYATVKFWYFIPRVRINWYFRTERFYREFENPKNRKRSKFCIRASTFKNVRFWIFSLPRIYFISLFLLKYSFTHSCVCV